MSPGNNFLLRISQTKKSFLWNLVNVWGVPGCSPWSGWDYIQDAFWGAFVLFIGSEMWIQNLDFYVREALR